MPETQDLRAQRSACGARAKRRTEKVIGSLGMRPALRLAMQSHRRVVRHILVAVEAAESASCLDQADRVARAFGASLKVLHVLPRPAVASELLHQWSVLSEKVAEDTSREQAAFEASIVVGDPFTRIAEQADAADIDLVVVGTHERQGLDRWRSVSAAVARAASCSVLVSKSSSPTRGPVLVACDFGHHTGAVVASAGTFAEKLGEPLVALHAVEPNRHDLALMATAILSGTVSPQPDPSSTDAYLQVAEGALYTELAAAGVNGRPEVAAGSAAELIVRRARELHASLVVVGTHDRSALGSFLLGSVGDAVVRDAHCSVLVVRPPRPPIDAEQTLRKRDTLSVVATEAVEGAVGAVAGAVVGSLAGPVGIVAGAALGAAAAVALGWQSEGEQHEAALHVRELDAIDAEHDFFAGKDEDEVPTNQNPMPPESKR